MAVKTNYTHPQCRTNWYLSNSKAYGFHFLFTQSCWSKEIWMVLSMPQPRAAPWAKSLATASSKPEKSRGVENLPSLLLTWCLSMSVFINVSHKTNSNVIQPLKKLINYCLQHNSFSKFSNHEKPYKNCTQSTE